MFKLRKEIIRSKGVTYLNSKDEGFLLNLAYSERLEDLNQAAITVSRLGQKCSDFGLNRFDIIYNDLKHGIIDRGKLEFGRRNVHKIIERMKKSIYSIANLHAALENLANLAELESSERKLEWWKNTLGPKQMSNLEYVKEKIAFQNKQVQHYREILLWNQGFDKNIEHMARIVCIIYAQICSIFGPYISDRPSLSKNTRPNSNHKKLQFWFHHQIDEELDYCLIKDRDKHEKPISRSGPIPYNSKKDKVRFFSREMNQNSPDNKNRSGIDAMTGNSLNIYTIPWVKIRE
ncbi:putative ribulose bisphosphate carboxylase/oxygenase activase 1, chloroplastic-like isoform X1 [Fagus crenata]